MLKNRLNVKLHRVYLIAFISLFLLITSTKLLATECYDEFRKSCIEDEGIPYISDNFDCNMNEQQFSKAMYDNFDSITYIASIEESIAAEKRGIKGREIRGGEAYSFKFGVCYYETLKKYRQTGLRPNSNKASSQSSNSGSSNQPNAGSSSQSDNKANRQSANNQSSSNSNNQTNASSSSASSQNQSNPQGNSSNSDSNTGLSMKPEQEVLVNTAAQKYASESTAFEASHKGLKRTHNKEDEASRCLVIENRKIKNTCDFRVEYTFCAYKPNLKAFSAAFEMAAAFDCEQRKFGSAGISAKRIDAGTYTAEVVYVFGCKDPSHPTGVTYERGRGLSGRCSE